MKTLAKRGERRKLEFPRSLNLASICPLVCLSPIKHQNLLDSTRSCLARGIPTNTDRLSPIYIVWFSFWLLYHLPANTPGRKTFTSQFQNLVSFETCSIQISGDCFYEELTLIHNDKQCVTHCRLQSSRLNRCRTGKTSEEWN